MRLRRAQSYRFCSIHYVLLLLLLHGCYYIRREILINPLLDMNNNHIFNLHETTIQCTGITTAMDSGSSPLHVTTNNELLSQILSTLQSIQSDYRRLFAAVETIEGRMNALACVKQLCDAVEDREQSAARAMTPDESPREDRSGPPKASIVSHSPGGLLVAEGAPGLVQTGKPVSTGRSFAQTVSSRIILTTYPGQSGIDPLTMNWGHQDPIQRGPVVVSRSQSTIRRRNGTTLLGVSE